MCHEDGSDDKGAVRTCNCLVCRRLHFKIKQLKIWNISCTRSSRTNSCTRTTRQTNNDTRSALDEKELILFLQQQHKLDTSFYFNIAPYFVCGPPAFDISAPMMIMLKFDVLLLTA